MKKCLFVSLILLAGLVGSASAQNKSVEKIELSLAKGNYLEAKKLNKSFLKKNKNGSLLLSKAYLLQAEVHAGLGEFSSVKPQLNYALGLLGSEDSLYALSAVRASSIFLIAGLPRQAAEYMSLAEGSKWSNRLAKEPDYVRSKTKLLLHQGLYYEADSLIPLLEGLAIEAAKRKSVFEWKKKKLKERKLSKWELQETQRFAGDAINLKIACALKRGNLTLAADLIKKEEKNQKNLLGASDRIYLDFKRLEALLFEKKQEYRESYKLLDKLILDCKGSSKGVNYSRSSLQVFEMIRSKIYLHLLLDDPLSAESENDRYLKFLRVYAKKNLFQTELRSLATDQISIDRRNVLSAEKSLLKKLDNKERIPEDHELRLDLYKALSILHIRQNLTEKVLDDQKQIIQLQKQLYPAGSAKLAMAKLELLQIRLAQENDFAPLKNELQKTTGLVIDKQFHQKSPAMFYKNTLEAELLSLEDQNRKAYDLIVQTKNECKELLGEKNEVYASLLGQQAIYAMELGKLEESAQLFEQSLDLLKEEKGTKSKEYIQTLQSYARLFLLQANYEKAESILDRSEVLDKRASRNLKKEQNLQLAASRAVILMRRGQYQEAGEYLKALKTNFISKYGAEHRLLYDTYMEEAALQLISGQYAEAGQSINIAVSICEKVYPKASLKLNEALFMRSQVLHAMGDYKEAEKLLRTVLASSTSLLEPGHYRLAGIYNQLGLTTFIGGSGKAEAEKNFKEAYRIGKEALSEKHPLTADYAKNLAYYYIETGRAEEALKLLTSSEEIYREIYGKRSLKVAEIKYLLGDLLSLQGEYKSAASRYEDAIKYITETFGQEHPELVKVRGKQARMYYSSGRWQEAAQVLQLTTEKYLSFTTTYFPTLSDRQKSQYWNSIKPDFQLFAHIAASKSKEDPALAGLLYDHTLNTKAILLSSSLKIRETIRSKGDTVLSQLFDDWVANRELLSSSLSMSMEDLLLAGISIPQLEKNIEELERKLNASSEEVTKSIFQKKVSWKEVQASLKPNEVAVEILRFPTFNRNFTDTIQYVALVLRKEDALPKLVLLPNGNDMEGKFYKYYRNAFKFGNDDLLSYQNYWAPVKVLIPDGALIILSADGIYSQINVLTLRDPDGKYVLDRNDLALVSNTKDLLQRKENTGISGKQLVLLGNPEYYEELNPDDLPPGARIENLKGAEDEIYSIRTLFRGTDWKSTMLINEQVTEDTIKSMSQLDLIHIATHGFFLDNRQTNTNTALQETAQNPLLRSGLLLTGSGDFFQENVYELNKRPGILTAFEVMNMNFENTELVVLSACETGSGEVVTGEGVFGLQRAFMVAGADAMVMSLFKVSDETTQELMQSFYLELIKTGKIRESFIKAMRDLREKYDKPINWGAFTMVGGI